MNITFADFFKTFKDHLDSEVKVEKHICSDCELMSYLLDPVIKMKNIENKNGELLYLNKSRVSRILTNKDNIPTAISSEYPYLKTNKDIKSKYIVLFENCISLQHAIMLLKSLSDEEYKDNPYEALYYCFIYCLCNNNIRSSNESILIWKNGCNSIHFVSGNIFDYCFRRKSGDEIIVIPVNTNFDAHVSTKTEYINPLISSETLHGKWIQRCENSGITEQDIQNKINTFLKTHYSNKSSNRNYPVGTIVPFDTTNGSTYLVALAVFDCDNRAHSNEENMRNVIEKIIDFYDYNGQGYPLYIPLLGTGRSRIGLSFKQSYELIKDVLLKEKEHIQGSVNIIALPEAFKEIVKGDSNAI